LNSNPSDAWTLRWRKTDFELSVPAIGSFGEFWLGSEHRSGLYFLSSITTGVDLRGTESLLTHRWREMDSNFQYAGAVSLVVGPFGWVVLCDPVRSGRGASGTARGISDGAGRS